MSVENSVVLLSNPMSGVGSPALTAAYAVARLRQLDLEVEHLVATSDKHALELAEEAVANRPVSLVLVGGDGLLSSVLPAVLGSDVPVALIPAGRGDDTARALGIPTDDPTRAADIAASRHTTRIDVGTIVSADGTTSYFTTVANADSSVEANTTAKRLLRHWNHPFVWYLAGLSSLVRTHHFRVRLDQDEPFDVHASLLTIGNGPSYGGGLRVCPSADLTDGLLDVTVVAPDPVSRAMVPAGLIARNTISGHGTTTYRARTVELDYLDSNSRPLLADGGEVGTLPATISVLPGALEVIIP